MRKICLQSGEKTAEIYMSGVILFYDIHNQKSSVMYTGDRVAKY